MADLKRAQAGEDFAPSASTWNEFCETAEWARGLRGVGARGRTVPRNGEFWALVTAVYPDYLECKLANTDGAAGDAETVPVAKPFELRHDARYYDTIETLASAGAQTVNVTGEGGYVSEVWKTTPGYVAGVSVILVGWCDVPLDLGGGGEPCHYIDLNLAARAWGRENEYA